MRVHVRVRVRVRVRCECACACACVHVCANVREMDRRCACFSILSLTYYLHIPKIIINHAVAHMPMNLCSDAPVSPSYSQDQDDHIHRQYSQSVEEKEAQETEEVLEKAAEFGRTVFNAADADNSGACSKSEIKRYFKKNPEAKASKVHTIACARSRCPVSLSLPAQINQHLLLFFF